MSVHLPLFRAKPFPKHLNPSDLPNNNHVWKLFNVSVPVHMSYAHTARGNTGLTTAFAQKMPLGYATVGIALQQTSVKTHSVEIMLEPVRIRQL